MVPTPENRFRVLLYGQEFGVLHHRENFTRFEFDMGVDANNAVLGLQFTEGRLAANVRLPPWFSNLLPEGQLLAWIERSYGQSSEINLLARLGGDLPGAVSVLPVDGPVAEVATDPLCAFSLGGVGLKFSMIARGGRFTPATGTRGDWIVKLPAADVPHLPRNELAMMTLARAVGIDVPDVALVHRDQIDLPAAAWQGSEAFAYAIRRFDRGPDGEAIHMEDLAQVRGFYPEQKYTGAFEMVASLVYGGQRDVEGLREFARRLAFNVVIGNGDAHLKNWSLIYRDRRDRRVPTLAPAYDLVCTAVYAASSNPEDLGLKFCGSKRFEAVRLSHFAALDARLSANAGLVDIVADVVDRVVAEWPSVEPLLPEEQDLRARVDARLSRGIAMLRR